MGNIENRNNELVEKKLRLPVNPDTWTIDSTNEDLGRNNARKLNRLEMELLKNALNTAVSNAVSSPKEFFSKRDYSEAFKTVRDNWTILDDFHKREFSMAVLKYIDYSDKKWIKYDIRYNINETIFVEPYKDGFRIINATVFRNGKDVTNSIIILPWTEKDTKEK